MSNREREDVLAALEFPRSWIATSVKMIHPTLE